MKGRPQSQEAKDKFQATLAARWPNGRPSGTKGRVRSQEEILRGVASRRANAKPRSQSSKDAAADSMRASWAKRKEVQVSLSTQVNIQVEFETD